MSNDTKFLRASDAIKNDCENCKESSAKGCRVCLNKISKIQKYHDGNIPS